MALRDWLNTAKEIPQTISSGFSKIKEIITPMTQQPIDPIKREIEDLRSTAPKYNLGGYSSMMSTAQNTPLVEQQPQQPKNQFSSMMSTARSTTGVDQIPTQQMQQAPQQFSQQPQANIQQNQQVMEGGRFKPQSDLYTPEQLSAFTPEQRGRVDVVEKTRVFADRIRQEAEKRGRPVSDMNDDQLVSDFLSKVPEGKEFFQQEVDVLNQPKQGGTVSEQFASEKGLVGGFMEQFREKNKGNPLLDNPFSRGLFETIGMIAGGIEKVGKGSGTTIGTTIGGEKEGFNKENALLDMMEGAQSVVFGVAAPVVTTAFNVLAETPVTKQIFENILSPTVGGLGRLTNELPLLNSFKKGLTDENKQRFDTFIGGNVLALLMGTKGKRALAMNPTKAGITEFIKNNANPTAIQKNFQENVLGIMTKTKQGIQQGAKGTESLGTYGLNAISQTTPEARTFAMRNPKLLTEKQNIINREGGIDVALDEVAQKVTSKMDELKEGKGEIGKAYEFVKSNQTEFDTTPIIRKTENILDNNNIKIGADGKLDFTSSKIGLKSDQNAIQDAFDLIKAQQGKKLKGDTGLNLRQSVDDKIDWRNETSDKADIVVKQIRKGIDEELGNNIEGLKELDAEFGPLAEEIRTLQKGFFNKDGTIKSTAYNTLLKITDIRNKPKMELMERMIPGITKEMDAIKYAKMIKEAGERTTGASLRGIGALAGGSFIGGPMGIVSGIASFIATNPNTTIKIFKMIGGLRGLENKVMKGIKLNADEIKQVDNAIMKVKEGKQKADLQIELNKFKQQIEDFNNQKALPNKNITPVIPEGGLPQVKVPQGPTQRPLKNIVEISKPYKEPSKIQLPKQSTQKSLPSPETVTPKKEINTPKTVKTPEPVKTTPKELDPLVEEAKKYKTAEEFAKDIMEKKGLPKFDIEIKMEKRLKELNDKIDESEGKYRGKPGDLSQKQMKDIEETHKNLILERDKISYQGTRQYKVPFELTYDIKKDRARLKDLREQANTTKTIKTPKK